MNCTICRAFDAAPPLARCLTCQCYEHHAGAEAQPMEGISPQERLLQEKADVFGAERTRRVVSAISLFAKDNRL